MIYQQTTIIGLLNSKSPCDKLKAMFSIVDTNVNDNKIVKIVSALCKSDERQWGYRFGDIAMATLHIIGAQEYKGENPIIIQMIETKLGMYKRMMQSRSC